MNSRKKSIDSVEVDYDHLYKTCPPQYDVAVKYKDGSVKNKIMFDEAIQTKYGNYLNKNRMFSGDNPAQSQISKESNEHKSHYLPGKK